MLPSLHPLSLLCYISIFIVIVLKILVISSLTRLLFKHEVYYFPMFPSCLFSLCYLFLASLWIEEIHIIILIFGHFWFVLCHNMWPVLQNVPRALA